ncbi:hypothetical protein K439DRAFT_1621062 [Ramaria rubella]|nr:hypothetical protein K439DRAFT_1621062 [Ramaria rubella]
MSDTASIAPSMGPTAPLLRAPARSHSLGNPLKALQQKIPLRSASLFGQKYPDGHQPAPGPPASTSKAPWERLNRQPPGPNTTPDPLVFGEIPFGPDPQRVNPVRVVRPQSNRKPALMRPQRLPPLKEGPQPRPPGAFVTNPDIPRDSPQQQTDSPPSSRLGLKVVNKNRKPERPKSEKSKRETKTRQAVAAEVAARAFDAVVYDRQKEDDGESVSGRRFFVHFPSHLLMQNTSFAHERELISSAYTLEQLD